MRVPALILAGALSFAPFALAAASGGTLAPRGASWLALALLPWLALAGLPRAPARPGFRASRAAWLLPVALALPPAALGWTADAAAAGAASRATTTALALLLVVGLWSAAAEAARPSGPARNAYGLAWLVLVPGTALLATGLGWASRTAPREGAPSWLGLVERVGPLVWGLDRAGAPGASALGPGVWPAAVGNVLVALAVLAAVRVALRRPGGEGA